MIINSVQTGFNRLANRLGTDELLGLFDFLYVKYESPSLLTSNLQALSLEELELLMLILQGHNPKAITDFNFPISKKAATVLITAPSSMFTFNDNIILRIVIVSELLAVKNDDEFVFTFLEQNRYFKNHINQFHEKLTFWKQALMFLSKIDFTVNVISFSEFIHFFIFKTHLDKTDYSLQSRTAKSVTKAILKWHEDVEYEESFALINTHWDTPQHYDYIKPHGIFRIEKVINGEMLYDESKHLKHCVFSYIQECISGYTKIWSMKKKKSGHWVHHLTIEVNHGIIAQISGLANSEPSVDEMALADEWFNSTRLA